MGSGSDDSQSRCVTIELEILISAPKERIWTALIQEIDLWWPVRIHGTEHPGRIRFDPVPGGHVIEQASDEEGLLWYTVIHVKPPESLTLSGCMFRGFGGPATSILALRLETQEDASTLFQVTDTLTGKVDDETAHRVRSAWISVFEERLKTHVERLVAN